MTSQNVESEASSETMIAFDDMAKNETCYTLTWENISYTVKDKQTKTEKQLITNMSGILKPGDLCAVIGASGAGKSTFLDVIAGRKPANQMTGNVYVNGRSDAKMKHVSKYCTQEDALFGSLTVVETLRYAAEFNTPQTTPKEEKERIIDELMMEFGLKDVENTIIGTPLIKGCSGGQVRRVSVASQLIGMEGGILFLDEPTSGLDSVAAFSVVEAIKRLAERKKCTIMATIHQPSTETFEMFSHLLIIAKGQTVYFGEREGALQHFADLGHPIPNHANPSDVYLRLTNTDFLEDKISGEDRVAELVQGFKKSAKAVEIQHEIETSKKLKEDVVAKYGYTNSFIHQTGTLINRAFVNAAKNPLSYWVRVAMYTALAVLMGTTWLRLGADQQDVVNRMVAIYFSVAFLSFMAVAGIPAFLEERHVFLREKANGLYSIESYLLSNFLVSVPFLAIIALAFSVVGYFAMGFQEEADNFFVFVGYMFLMLNVAEAQVVFISALIPIFVAALTVTAFLNGLWMVVQGFALLKVSDVPPGWRYTFHYIDFQKYTFESLLKNEMTGLTFNCEPSPNSISGCACMVPPANASDCTYTGEDVMKYFEHDDVKYGVWAAILIAILVFFKLATWITLRVKDKQNK